MKRLPLIALILLGSFALRAQEQTATDSLKIMSKKIDEMLRRSSFSSQIFMGYRYFDYVGSVDDLNEFAIKRGYLNFKQPINDRLSVRITPDITIDKEGDGKGDVELRLKYCYMEYKHPGGNIFTEPSVLFGEVFTPLIEFEEKINRYRVEGPHYQERIKQISSADFGLVIASDLGGKMDANYRKRVSNSHMGRLGSFALGVYNGGGYHALERNNNKTFQWRLTVRPFSVALPGFQVTYSGAEGKGNTEEAPYWSLHSGMLSYENEYISLTGQYFSAVGDFSGEYIDKETFLPLKNYGYSTFAEVKILKKKVSLFGRYDTHIIETEFSDVDAKRYIVGIAYHIIGKSKIIMDYDYWESSDATKPNVDAFEVALELAF